MISLVPVLRRQSVVLDACADRIRSGTGARAWCELVHDHYKTDSVRLRRVACQYQWAVPNAVMSSDDQVRIAFVVEVSPHAMRCTGARYSHLNTERLCSTPGTGADHRKQCDTHVKVVASSTIKHSPRLQVGVERDGTDSRNRPRF